MSIREKAQAVVDEWDAHAATLRPFKFEVMDALRLALSEPDAPNWEVQYSILANRARKVVRVFDALWEVTDHRLYLARFNPSMGLLADRLDGNESAEKPDARDAVVEAAVAEAKHHHRKVNMTGKLPKECACDLCAAVRAMEGNDE